MITSDDWKEEAAFLKSQRDEIKKLLIEAIKLLRRTRSICQVSRHNEKDRHGWEDACPIDKRLWKLFEAYDNLVYMEKKNEP